jgi:iron complex transport system substrate-binding protein
MTTTPRRLAALAVALVGLAAACGTSEDDDTAAAGTTDAPAESSGTSGGAGECEGVEPAAGPISVTDAFGRTVELVGPPERVVVLEWQQVEDVLSLCLTPVAIADVDGYRTWNTAEPLPDGVTDVGTRGEPNLDTLFGTDPDLVIVEAAAIDDTAISQLEAYDVPVLATRGADAADPIANMLGTFELIADATGRSEQAAVVVDEFETALAEATAEVGGADVEVTDFVYFDGYIAGGNVALRPFGQGSLVGELGEALGLTNAWTGEVDEAYGLGTTDIEGLTAVGDASFFHTTSVEEEFDEIVDELEANQVWQSLPAVVDGRVFGFPAGVWTFGGPRSSIQVLDAYVDVLIG